MHIGILVTNTDESDFAQARPKDGEKFRALLQPFAPDWTFTPVIVKDGVFPEHANSFDGYVITGSPASANGNEDWITTLMSLIREIEQRRIPTVGVCFGHQIIARALGGLVGKNPGGWGFGISPTTFTTTRPWMSPEAETINLYAAHSEQVLQLPEKAELLGGSAFCPVGSYAIGDHIFTTEYHPEMTTEFVIDLSHAFESYIGTGIANKARAQFKTPADGKLFARWMINFFNLPR
jgi:GMP synthase-like glutamine amidotransferase